MESNKSYSNIWRVYKTVCEMLRDRKYLVPDELYDLTFTDFISRFETFNMSTDTKSINRENLTIRSEKEGDSSDVIFVFFCKENSVGISIVSDLMHKLKADGARDAILVVKDNVTPHVNKVVQAAAPHFFIEIFKEIELLINVTKHVLVPRHILLSDEEKKELLEKYKMKETQLSRILITDPISRYYGLKESQVVKIIRASETAGRYVTYRIVVK